MQKVKVLKEPLLIPLYEFNDNNMTINDIKFEQKHESSINLMNVINSNALSNNLEDIMKSKLITCSMWYTALTSQLFPLDII